MCKGLTIDGVGVSRDTVLQEIQPGADFETDEIAKDKLGGATVERLGICFATASCFVATLAAVTRAIHL